MTQATWLVDKSALWRAGVPAVGQALEWRLRRGLLAVSIVTELEIGFSAQSVAGHQLMRRTVVDRLIPVALSRRAEVRARQVQAMLVDRGQHRSAGVADLLLAATAEVEGLAVLHYDRDFDLISALTGQPCEWVVPRGTA